MTLAYHYRFGSNLGWMRHEGPTAVDFAHDTVHIACKNGLRNFSSHLYIHSWEVGYPLAAVLPVDHTFRWLCYRIYNEWHPSEIRVLQNRLAENDPKWLSYVLYAALDDLISGRRYEDFQKANEYAKQEILKMARL